jgi:hypothetical protein
MFSPWRPRIAATTLALALALIASGILSPAQTLAQASGQMSYQGYLRDAAAQPVSGSVNLQFYIYDSEVGGTACWGPEPHVGVQVVDGLFELVLGEILPIPASCLDGSVRWLETWVSGAPLSPRKAITGHAITAKASTAEAQSGVEDTHYMTPAKTKDAIDAFMARLYPVGTVYTSVVPTDPAVLFGFGAWTAFGAGRVLVGLDPGQTEFSAAEETGGEKMHTLTVGEMPAHAHTMPNMTSIGAGTGALNSVGPSGTASTSTVGGGGAHNNLQPYIVVYFFKRTG